MIISYNAIICRYNEIAIKGNNRSQFELLLIENLYRLLAEIPNLKISRIRGRVWVQHRQRLPFTSEEINFAERQLVKAFGLESFSPVIMCSPEIETVCQAVDSSADVFFAPLIAAGKTAAFRIRASRSDKTFPLQSKEIEIRLATVIGDKYPREHIKVNLTTPEITIGCEIRDKFAFIFYKTCRGPGGLPAGSNPPVLALLSGGIDSPVACYMAMKRGCLVNYITFHSDPYTPPATIDKVKKLAGLLNHFQRPGKLYLCNLAPVQKLIRDLCTPRIRTVLYRRAMLRIAEKVALRSGSKALLTGESIGQVASQTIVNMNTINYAVRMLVIRPLAGMDKSEAVTLSEHIGAFEISKEQVPDSCTVFAPTSPSTAVTIHRAESEEAVIPEYDRLIDEIIEQIEVVTITPLL